MNFARLRTVLLWLVAILAAVAFYSFTKRTGGPAPTTPVTQSEAIDRDSHAGEEMHTSRLIHEKSPYLLQHAHNPVDWYPWGEEAFAKARREDKPVFLSVGYSTCYWCHVMEKESFEDPEVARILNEHFVAIKVDREERPDIDEQYMLATQLATGRGGWPNSVWLTPERKPWMAGTYFPKGQFISALSQLAEAWKNRRADVEKQAGLFVSAIGDAGDATMLAGGADAELTTELVDDAVAALAGRFDPVNAGFGKAPKFPPHGTLRLLLRQYRDTKNEALLEPVTRTLDAMWLGGIRDHIGGGFHRYSTDDRWLVPHFEKMLYDNAQLMRNYADAFATTGDGRYRDAVADIFAWIEREMTSPEGAFYSAIDSGEVGGEGEAYVWRVAEIEEILGREDGALFAETYGLEKRGNFAEEASGHRSGANIPHLTRPLAAIAAGRGVEPETFARKIAAMRSKLLAARLSRPQPHKDDKILTSWNGLMIAALAHAGRTLEEPRYTAAAARAADFILGKMTRDGRLLRTYRDGEAKLPGYLDDHAYFAEGLIELHRAVGEIRWLEEADRLGIALLRDFEDAQVGGFFFTAKHHEDLLMRSKSLGGGGNVPDANGVATQVLLDLAKLTENAGHRAAARRTLDSLAPLMKRSPFSTEHLLLASIESLRERPSPSAAPSPTHVAGAAQPADPDVSARTTPATIRAYVSRLVVEPGGSLDVAVAIDIEDGWHLYGENPDAAFLVPTTLAIESAAPVVAGEVTAPEAHRAMDPVLNQELNTYSGRIWFRVLITIGADADPGAITLALKVDTQACDESRCLPPETTSLRIPIQVDPEARPEIRHAAIFGGGGSR